MGRPWLRCVWERGFATETEADEAYEQISEWLDTPPLEVDRLDGHTIRLYLDTNALEAQAQFIEAGVEPMTITSFCACGHIAVSHKGEDSLCSVRGCRCTGFELATTTRMEETR